MSQKLWLSRIHKKAIFETRLKNYILKYIFIYIYILKKKKESDLTPYQKVPFISAITLF